MGYKLSKLDTFVTTDWATYCEEWFHIPVHKSNQVQVAMRTGNHKLLPYLDVPKIRAIIGTAKDREDFSSDPRGKITLMGKDGEYAMKMKDSPFRVFNSVGSAIQDIILATVDQPEPLHLPRQIYGIGKPAPSWDVSTWLSIIRRGPLWKQRVYYFTMKTVLSGRQDLLPRGYLKEGRHFGHENWVENLEIPADDPVRGLIAVTKEEIKQQVFPPGALEKLTGFGYLVPESKLLKYYLFQERLYELEGKTSSAEELFEKVSERVELLEFEMDDLEQVVTDFVDRYSMRPFDLKQESNQDLYYSEATEFLEEGNPLKVTEVDFPLIEKFSKRLKPKSLYEEEGLELYEWFIGARFLSKQGEDFELPPPHLLEDDPLILKQIGLAETSHYFVVTNDMAMLRKAARKVPAVTIVQISCEDLITMTTSGFEDTEEVIEKLMPMYDCEWEDITLLVDTGSVTTWIELHTSSKGGLITHVSGLPWNRDVKPENFTLSREKRQLGRKQLTPSQLGYPQKGFRYKRGHRRT